MERQDGLGRRRMRGVRDRLLASGEGEARTDEERNSGTTSVYNLYPTRTGHPFPPPSAPLPAPQFSHQNSLRASLNTTASALTTGRVTCLSWTSDGYCLACGWALGWSVWSVYGRLGGWSVSGSLESGYGVEGERSESFEDHFMVGVRDLVGLFLSFELFLSGLPIGLMRVRQFWSPGNLELFVLCPPPVHPKKKGATLALLLLWLD